MKNKEQYTGERQETVPGAIPANPDVGQRHAGVVCAGRVPGAASAVNSVAGKTANGKPRPKSPKGCVVIRRIRLR